MNKTPTILIIMDGLGVSDQSDGNAVRAANTPCLDRFRQEFAATTLIASGPAAGLTAGQPGNSETGHLNIGAGRIVTQDLPRISQAIADGSFASNPAFVEVMDHCAQSGAALHLIGLLSESGIHAHISHLFALMRMARDKGVSKIRIHAFLDGRGTATGADFLRRVLAVCADLGVGEIATVMGRDFAMDRDGRWDLIEQAYDALVYGGNGESGPAAPLETVEKCYAAGIRDELIDPIVCDPDGTISDHDGVIFFNFRADRMRELVRALTDPTFDGFTRQWFPLTCVSLTDYHIPGVEAAFPFPPVRDGLGEYLSRLGLTQLRIAETVRFPQLTTCLNGGVEAPFDKEDRIEVPSPTGVSWDLQPEMNAEEVRRICVEKIESGAYDLIAVNFPNCDVVAHTGNFQAIVKAVECVDACVGSVTEAALKMGGIAMITSACGNAEQMFRPDGGAMPDSTANPVPFIICGAGSKLRPGRLADIAPTLLDVMGLACPDEMEGRTLIVE